MDASQAALLAAVISGGLGIAGGWLLGRQSEKKEERQRKAQRTQDYTDTAVQALSHAKLTLQELWPDGLIMESEPGQSWRRVHEAIVTGLLTTQSACKRKTQPIGR